MTEALQSRSNTFVTTTKLPHHHRPFTMKRIHLVTVLCACFVLYCLSSELLFYMWYFSPHLDRKEHKPTGKFLIVSPMGNGGLNNGLYDLNVAAEYAQLLGRRLLIPEIPSNAHTGTNRSRWLRFSWQQTFERLFSKPKVVTSAAINQFGFLRAGTSYLPFHELIRSDIDYSYVSNDLYLANNRRTYPVCEARYLVDPNEVTECLKQFDNEQYVIFMNPFYLAIPFINKGKPSYFHISDRIMKAANLALSQKSVGRFITIHIRLGDFDAYCRGKASDCNPPVDQVLSKVAEIQQNSNYDNVIIISNEPDDSVIQKFVKQNTGWFTNKQILAKSPHVAGLLHDENAVALLDMAICVQSDLFYGNTYSSLSGNVALMRKSATTSRKSQSIPMRVLVNIPSSNPKFERHFDS